MQTESTDHPDQHWLQAASFIFQPSSNSGTEFHTDLERHGDGDDGMPSRLIFSDTAPDWLRWHEDEQQANPYTSACWLENQSGRPSAPSPSRMAFGWPLESHGATHPVSRTIRDSLRYPRGYPIVRARETSPTTDLDSKKFVAKVGVACWMAQRGLFSFHLVQCKNYWNSPEKSKNDGCWIVRVWPVPADAISNLVDDAAIFDDDEPLIESDYLQEYKMNLKPVEQVIVRLYELDPRTICPLTGDDDDFDDDDGCLACESCPASNVEGQADSKTSDSLGIRPGTFLPFTQRVQLFLDRPHDHEKSPHNRQENRVMQRPAFGGLQTSAAEGTPKSFSPATREDPASFARQIEEAGRVVSRFFNERSEDLSRFGSYASLDFDSVIPTRSVLMQSSVRFSEPVRLTGSHTSNNIDPVQNTLPLIDVQYIDHPEASDLFAMSQRMIMCRDISTWSKVACQNNNNSNTGNKRSAAISQLPPTQKWIWSWFLANQGAVDASGSVTMTPKLVQDAAETSYMLIQARVLQQELNKIRSDAKHVTLNGPHQLSVNDFVAMQTLQSNQLWSIFKPNIKHGLEIFEMDQRSMDLACKMWSSREQGAPDRGRYYAEMPPSSSPRPTNQIGVFNGLLNSLDDLSGFLTHYQWQWSGSDIPPEKASGVYEAHVDIRFESTCPNGRLRSIHVRLWPERRQEYHTTIFDALNEFKNAE